MHPTLAQDRNWSRSCRTAATHRDMVSRVTGDMSLPRPPPPLQLHHWRLGLIMWEQEAGTVGTRWLSTGNPGTDAAAAGWFVSSLINTTQTAITRQTPGWGGDTALHPAVQRHGCLTVGLRFQMSATLLQFSCL